MTNNHRSRLERLDVQGMPKTILDAIVVAQKLHIRYVWIDSLCIIQEDIADKVEQISQMRFIFNDTYLTIVAASATKVRDGFL